MATARRNRNGGGDVTSRRRLILACIGLAGCCLAMLAAIMSLATTLSQKTASLNEMQGLVDEYRGWRHDMRQRSQILSSELENTVATAQERYDSLEEERARNRELRTMLEALEAKVLSLQDDCREQLAAERQKTADQIAIVATLREDLAALQDQFDKIKIQLAEEQSANKQLAMELAARKAQEKEERFLAPAVMDVIYATLAENQRLRDAYDDAIKDEANFPELANAKWDIPDNPDPDDPIAAKLLEMRRAYYLAWCAWKAFDSVDPGRTPEDYQAAHHKYTGELKMFLGNLKMVAGRLNFNPPGNVLAAQRDNEFTYLTVVDKYRELSAEEEAKILVAKLEDANEENRILAEQLVNTRRDLAKTIADLDEANEIIITVRNKLAAEIIKKRKALNDLAREQEKLRAEQLAHAKTEKQLDNVTKERDDLLAGVKEKEKARQDAFEKRMSPSVVIDWKSAVRPSTETLANAKKTDPLFSDRKWGITEKPTGETRKFNVEQDASREAYFEVKRRYEMFDKVSGQREVVLPKDYQDAYDAYQLSQLELIKKGLRTRPHVQKDKGSVDYYNPAPSLEIENKSKRLAYERVVTKYRKLAGDL